MSQHLITLAGVFASTGLPDMDGNYLLKFLGAIVLFLIIWNQGKQALGKKPEHPDPVNIRQTEDEVTRREYDDLKGGFEDIKAELPEMERRIINEVKVMATGAYQGRQKLWKKVNDNAERIKGAETNIEALKDKSS